MKRGRSDTLTGGSRDVNPQIMTIAAAQTGTEADTDVQVILPVQRLNQRSGKSLVMEILWVEWWLQDMITVAGAGQWKVQGLLTTNPSPSTGLNIALQDPRNISVFRHLGQTGAASNAGFQFTNEAFHREDDLTDGAGHGILVATDNLNINIQSSGTGIVNNFVLQVGYRWKEVALVEYIGIVQSQQT